MTEKKLRDSWETPPDFWEWVDGIFHFNLDACATYHNRKCEHHCSYVNETYNGLTSEWGRIASSVWVNPGYSNITPWLEKAYQETQEHENMTACVLIHSAYGTRWFKKYFSLAYEVWLLNPRIQFIAPKGIKQTSNPRDSMLFIFKKMTYPQVSTPLRFKGWK